MNPNLSQMAVATLPPTALINIQAHNDRLEEYVRVMAPSRPTSSKEGAAAQRMLWHAIKLMLTRDGNEFVHHFSETLRVIRENRKGAFSERYVYRFFDQLDLPADDRRNFERMLNLMLHTCDPTTRMLSMRQVDLRSSLSGLRDERQRQKVSAYYAL